MEPGLWSVKLSTMAGAVGQLIRPRQAAAVCGVAS
jgi:hypothetical protein